MSLKEAPRRGKQQQTSHRWTTEERTLICYLRVHRNWTWSQIQRTFFLLLSFDTVRVAYSKISLDARARYVSIASSLITSSCDRTSACHSEVSVPPLLPPNIDHSGRSARSVRPAISSTSSSKEGKKTVNNDSIPNRYCLRPNRPNDLQEDRSPYSFDPLRFPHSPRDTTIWVTRFTQIIKLR